MLLTEHINFFRLWNPKLGLMWSIRFWFSWMHITEDVDQNHIISFLRLNAVQRENNAPIARMSKICSNFVSIDYAESSNLLGIGSWSPDQLLLERCWLSYPLLLDRIGPLFPADACSPPSTQPAKAISAFALINQWHPTLYLRCKNSQRSQIPPLRLQLQADFQGLH